MNTVLVCLGKTDDENIRSLIEVYRKRILRYTSFEIREIPGLKKSATLAKKEVMSREADLILKHITGEHYMILLDEKGKEMPSKEFALLLNQRFVAGGKNLAFVLGGAYGVDDRVKNRADFILSLSRMTFPHQLVRLVFAEQLYRALTILRNEAYHHE